MDQNFKKDKFQSLCAKHCTKENQHALGSNAIDINFITSLHILFAYIQHRNGTQEFNYGEESLQLVKRRLSVSVDTKPQSHACQY